jgi:transcriptional regulator with XRE-family HTH domain
METFGLQLLNLRTYAGISQSELAERCGLPLGAVVRAERGETDPRPSLIRALADGPGLQASLLVTRTYSDLLPSPTIGPPSPDASPTEARRAWQAIRSELRQLYAAGEHHRMMASKLGLTRIQLQSQLQRLFREGMPKR